MNQTLRTIDCYVQSVLVQNLLECRLVKTYEDDLYKLM